MNTPTTAIVVDAVQQTVSLPQPTGAAVVASAQTADVADLRVVESHDLLEGREEVRIRHNNDYYRLRLTQNGKLILQK